MTVFVDTSALIALLDEDDQHHPEASATFRSLLGQDAELVTHNYVLVESIAVVDRRLGRESMRRLVDSLLPVLDTIWVDQAVHRAALVEHRSTGGKISLVDQVSFAVMRAHGIDSALAFDADFQAQGFPRPTVSGETRQGRRIGEVAEVYAAPGPERTDLVSVSEISARSGRPINTIQSWRRRHRDFPEPVAQLAAGPIWAWPTVAQWISTRTSAQSAGSGPAT